MLLEEKNVKNVLNVDVTDNRRRTVTAVVAISRNGDQLCEKKTQYGYYGIEFTVSNYVIIEW